MFEGFLAYGGNVIANNTQTRAIAESADCPLAWFKGPECEAIADAEEGEYGDPTLAPWYDTAHPELSSRFYGVYVTEVLGMDDSTRQVPVAEGVGHGGVVGRTRKAVRDVRVRAFLAAQGTDALSYGIGWLSRMLDPGACGQHATGCNTADLAFYAACPPGRADVTMPVPDWGLAGTNLAHDPAATKDTPGSVTYVGWASRWFGGGAGTGTVTLVTGATDGPIPGLTTYSRKKWTAVPAGNGDTGWSNSRGAGGGTATAGEGMVVTPLVTYTFSAYVRATSLSNKTANLTVSWRDSAGALLGTSPSATATLTPGLGWVRLTVTATAPANAVRAGIVTDCDGGVTWAVNDTFDGTGLLVEEGAVVNPYYDGNTPAVDAALGEVAHRYAWTGVVATSPSTHETGLVVAVPDEVAWEDAVQDQRRYLHDVGTTSGPLVTGQFASGPHSASMVEFVLTAERPWVYRALRELDLPPSLPVIIQDVPFNLVPYPSAELSSGTVLISTNHSVNPSAEVNVSTFTSGAFGGVIAQEVYPPAQTSALHAVGTKSVYVEYNTGIATSTPGYFYAATTVNIGHRAVAGERVSVNVWATGREGLSTTGNLGPLEVWAKFRMADPGGGPLGDVLLGVIPGNTGPFSVRGLALPVGADVVEIHVRQHVLAPLVVGANFELYVDAVAVTIP